MSIKILTAHLKNFDYRSKSAGSTVSCSLCSWAKFQRSASLYAFLMRRNT